MRLLVIALSAFIFSEIPAYAQSEDKHIHQREQLWLGAFNQTRFSKHWGMWVDVHYRMTGNFVIGGCKVFIAIGKGEDNTEIVTLII
jgi:hypothetical protein